MKKIKPAFFTCLTACITACTLGVQAKSTLWKITSERGTLYIQGSAHILKPENYPLAPEIEQAYSEAAALVLEVDMGEMLRPETQQLILSKALLTQPDTLQTTLSPEVYKEFSEAADAAGLPPEALNPFKPWFAMMTLTITKMQRLGLNENLGLDRHFYNKAQTDGKKVIGLESLDYQISLFDSLSSENPDDFIHRALAELTDFETDLNSLLTAWETGDFNTLDTLINKSFEGYPQLREKFITARNRAWVKQLAAMLKSGGTSMAVVGAGHLPGDEGVINLLSKKGFSVEQL